MSFHCNRCCRVRAALNGHRDGLEDGNRHKSEAGEGEWRCGWVREVTEETKGGKTVNISLTSAAPGRC
eukprot:3941537-Rhodomonas_salina.9